MTTKELIRANLAKAIAHNMPYLKVAKVHFKNKQLDKLQFLMTVIHTAFANGKINDILNHTALKHWHSASIAKLVYELDGTDFEEKFHPYWNGELHVYVSVSVEMYVNILKEYEFTKFVWYYDNRYIRPHESSEFGYALLLHDIRKSQLLESYFYVFQEIDCKYAPRLSDYLKLAIQYKQENPSDAIDLLNGITTKNIVSKEILDLLAQYQLVHFESLQRI